MCANDLHGLSIRRVCKLRSLNGLLLYFISLVLCFSYYEQYVHSSEPCVLCILQRFFMCGIGIPLVFNIQGSFNFRNIAASILSCILGGIVALYQWSQLLINDGVTNAPIILSLPMYIWSALLFFGVMIVLLFMLFLMNNEKGPRWTLSSMVSYGLFMVILLSQIFVTYYMCGVFIC